MRDAPALGVFKLTGQSPHAVAMLPVAGDHGEILSPETNFHSDLGKSAHLPVSPVPLTHCLAYLNFKLYRAELIFLTVLCLA